MILRFLPALLALVALPAFAQQAGSTGPSQLSEVYGDWTLNCATAEGVRDCAITQSLVDSETRQHVLSIELYAGEAGGLDGMMVLPFGLNFARGAALAIDDAALGVPLPFLTCLPAGCLVPVTFTGADADRLRAGARLVVTGTGAAENDPVPLTLSLTGLTTATKRLAELAAQ